MALADSVPGVSGGTVAFLLGFYDKFIMSLDHLMSGTKEERIEAIKFLIRTPISHNGCMRYMDLEFLHLNILHRNSQ